MTSTNDLGQGSQTGDRRSGIRSRTPRSRNRTEAPGCLVEQAVNAALDRAFDDAEALLLSRLGDVTLAMLSADFQKRLGDRRNRHRLETAHAS